MVKKLGLLICLLPLIALALPLDKVVAIVNNDVITASELDAQVEQMRSQILARKIQLPALLVLQKQVLQHLIDVNLQLQLAKANNIIIDNNELDKALERIAKSNNFSLTELRLAVEHQGLTWENYRENIRKEMLMQQIQQKAVGADINVSTQQVEDYLQTAQLDKSKYKYHIQNIVIPLPEEPTTEELQGGQQKALTLLQKIKAGEDFNRLAIAESSGQYALEGGDLGERNLAELPEVFAKKVIKMRVGEVIGPIRTGNGLQLIKLVSIVNGTEHHQVVKTHVRHILIKPDASTTVSGAEKQINNIYQQLIAGRDFAVMAKQYSVDAASAIKGGDLGWADNDELVPQFAEAMNALAINEISKPVKSPFGWHIIQVLARETVDDTEAYQRQKTRQFLQQRKFTEAVQNWQQHLRADAFVQIVDKKLA